MQVGTTIKRIALFCFAFRTICFAQSVPVFGADIPVTISGLTFDAMEPFISPDGNAIFFNSLNDGINTSLYYCGKINDSTFSLVGAVPVVNQPSPPHLDAVASLDTANNFYWVSTRNYPTDFDNLHRIRFLTSGYTNFGRVHGDIYIYEPGWLIMDAAINFSGDRLYYCNAHFNGCGAIPCRAALGIGIKANDSTFNKLPNSGTLLAAINDTTNYIVYAPEITQDGLELYFTRLLIGSINTEICVSTRADTSASFGSPVVLISSLGNVPEAATLTADKSKLYYHKKEGGVFKLFLKYRDLGTGIKNADVLEKVSVFPNPGKGTFQFEITETDLAGSEIRIRNILGEIVLHERTVASKTIVDITDQANGVYTAELLVKGIKGKSYFLKLVKGE